MEMASKRQKVDTVVECFETMWNVCIDEGGTPKWDSSCADLLMPQNTLIDGVQINRLEYEMIDFNDSLQKAIASTLTVLGTSPNEKGKGPVSVVRGVGGGKTRALIELYKALVSRPDMLAVCITYNQMWDAADDLKVYQSTFNSNVLVYALGVIARILSMIFNIKLYNVCEILMTLDPRTLSSRGLSILGDFMSFLAIKKSNVKHIVLLMDETMYAEDIISDLYPAVKCKDFTHVARYAMLNYEYPIGICGALVLSSLTIKPAGFSTSKAVYAFELPERLNSKEVVAKWWLRRNGKEIVVKTPEDNGVTTAQCKQVLELLAEVVNTLPRGLEIIKLFLLKNLSKEDESLVVTPGLISCALENLCSKFVTVYPRLVSGGLPPPDLMFDLLFGVAHRLEDERVVDGITRSLYTNSLKVFHPSASIELQSSIFSLCATLPAGTNAEWSDVTGRLMRMYNTSLSVVMSPFAGANNSGNLLKEMSFNWLSVLLVVAIDGGKEKIRLCDLLRIQLNGCYQDAESDELRGLLLDSVTLSVYSVIVEYQMVTSTRTHTAHDYFAELNRLGRKRLCGANTCAIIRSAGGDCWDYGIIFRTTEEPKRFRSIVFNVKSCNELDDVKTLHTLPADGPLPVRNGSKEAGCQCKQYLDYCSEFASGQGGEKYKLGSVAYEMMNQPFYAYQTTCEGPSYLSGRRLVLGRSDTQRFLGFNYDLFAAVVRASRVVV